MIQLHKSAEAAAAASPLSPGGFTAPACRGRDLSDTDRILVGVELRTAEEKRAGADGTPEQP